MLCPKLDCRLAPVSAVMVANMAAISPMMAKEGSRWASNPMRVL
jgi:hypothetical protein